MKMKIVALAAVAAGVVAADSTLKGSMSEPLLVCGAGRAFLVAPDGRVAWEKSGCGNIHRVWKHQDWVYYSNGELRRIDVVSGRDELVYKPCEKEGIYGFEVLKNGNIVVAENGTDYITELETGTWKPVVKFKGNPAAADGKVPGGAHHHYRMVRKTPKGTYLVCCSSANVVREYDKSGKLVWEQQIPAKITFDCLRRANGNTLVSHLDAVTEYTPDHQVAWQFRCEDAPDLKLANLCGIWEKKNGNLVVGTYANGVEDGSRTTAFEITRAKSVVWSYAAAGRRFSMMTAFPVGGWQWPIAWVGVTPEDELKMEAIVGTKLSAAPVRPRKVLMVARAFGYCHNDALAYGRRAFEVAAEKTGAFSLDFTEDVTVLGDAARLSGYDAVVVNNCTMISVKRFPAIEKALVEYVKGGKGLCLIHSAVDSFYDSETLQDMNGGLFWGHPWMAGGTWLFRNEEPEHPLLASFSGQTTFKTSDEIYMQATPPYSREKVRVLLSIDLSDAPTKAAADRWAKSRGADKLRADGDFAVSWVRRYGEGRVFYTSFGHDRRAFVDRQRLLHMLAGLQYCIGDVSCPDSPRK